MKAPVIEQEVLKWREKAYALQSKDRKRLKCFSIYVIIQCIVVFSAAATVLQCVWKPENGIFELDVLARIMYLYDTNVCKTHTHRWIKQIQDLDISNDTLGLNIIPIKHEPVSLNILTKLSGKTRKYVKLSIGLHAIWFTSTLILWIFIKATEMKVMKFILMIFCYSSISILIFDISMAILYVADIQQSLTKAMILRYSGWGMTSSQIQNPEEFGGWVPIGAACMWLRGGIFFFLNLYLVRFVRQTMQKIRGKEVRRRINRLYNVPFPDPEYKQTWNQDSLHYRAGEGAVLIKQSNSSGLPSQL